MTCQLKMSPKIVPLMLGIDGGTVWEFGLWGGVGWLSNLAFIVGQKSVLCGPLLQNRQDRQLVGLYGLSLECALGVWGVVGRRCWLLTVLRVLRAHCALECLGWPQKEQV